MSDVGVIDSPRFEILPFARGEQECALLPEPARITVTCSPKHGLDRTLEVGRRLRALGHAVTLHLSARMVRDREQLDQVLSEMAACGMDDAFVIGGDASAALGPYESALEVLEVLHAHPRRPRLVGIAGYPEGHPLIATSTLETVLRAKSAFADYVTTQLCFDAVTVLRWIDSVRDAGVTLPVLVGLPGVVSRRRLLEVSLRIGVGPSLAFVRNQGGFGNLLRWSTRTVDSLHAALSPLAGDVRAGFAGFHYFTFNRLLDTWRWNCVRAGRPVTHCERSQEVTRG